MARADAGKPRLTQRDLDALEWLESMRAIYESDLAVLLGRMDGRDPVSPTAVRKTIRRWSALGLARAEKAFTKVPRFVWPTTEGARLVGATSWTEPGWAVLRHTALISRVRLWLEDRGLGGQPVDDWISERRWRQRNQEAVRAGKHVPDGIAISGGAEHAIEVELSDKGPGKTLSTAVQLTRGHSDVIYVVPGQSQTARTVRGVLDKELKDKWRKGDGKITVLELPGDITGGGSDAGEQDSEVGA